MSNPIRLFQLYLNLAQSGKATAARLADNLGVSERTVYRDIERLRAAGVPVEGESHSGFRLREWPELPALFLSREEMGVLAAGAKSARSGSDPALVAAAESLLAKARAVVPAQSHTRLGLRR